MKGETALIAHSFGIGSILEGSRGEDLSRAIDVAAVAKLFRESGFVLFRGFPLDDEQFASVTRRFSSEFVTHGAPTRPQVGQDEYLTMADPGLKEIHLHSELSYLPAAPEVLWLCCMTPPSKDGQTIVCDGIELWSMFGDSTRQPFLDKKLRYSVFWPPSIWQRYFQVGAISELKDKLDGLESISYKVGQGDRLFLDYVTPAIRQAKYSPDGAVAFANAVLHWGLDGLHTFMAFDDSTAMPKPLISEIQALADTITVSIDWRAGDLAMIDNTRIMHGRRPFADPHRELHVRMGRSLVLDGAR